MAKKLRIGLIFGGRSASTKSRFAQRARLIEAMDTSKYEVVPIAITKTGNWLAPAVFREAFAEKEHSKGFSRAGSAKAKQNVSIIGDPSRKGLARLDPSGRAEPLDVVFPVLHGTFGEDGTIQGLF